MVIGHAETGPGESNRSLFVSGGRHIEPYARDRCEKTWAHHRIGLGTFADPQLDGGRCNESARDDLVELVSFGDREFLRYKPIKIDFGLIRGTKSIARGNLTLHREPADLDCNAVALAAHNCGGRVFAQVESMRERRALHARLVRVPGVLVDGVVVAPHSRKTYLPTYGPRISASAPLGGVEQNAPLEMPSGIRRIIAQRALEELRDARSVNFGFGIPGGIPALAAATGQANYWGTVEQGIHNGEMLDGPMFGSARDPDAIISSNDQFDFYSGGGIDMAFLGMGEMDAAGNVNVSKIGRRLVGPGSSSTSRRPLAKSCSAARSRRKAWKWNWTRLDRCEF